MERLVALLVLGLVVTGCASRCKDVAAVRSGLTSRAGAPNRGADLQVTVPFARANALIAEVLQQQPLSVPLELPALGPVPVLIATHPLFATVRAAKLLPGTPGHARFEVQLEISDPDEVITTIDAVAELAPVLTRANGASTLSIGVGPKNVLELRPALGPGAAGKLGAAVTRWLPGKLAGKVPQPLIDAAAAKVGSHLTGAAWKQLQESLLVRMGDLTHLRLRLPDVPIARIDLRSTLDALVVDIASDLPIRAGLAASAAPPGEISVRISGSTAAELANWALDTGLAPPWYTRSLKPSPSGEFRPRFDYLAGAGHPIKVYAFQERGGCSYFRVGVEAKLAIQAGALVVTATDRQLEASNANPVIEIAAWVKYFLTGAIDRSKRVAAHTQLTIGGRTLVTDVVSAALAHDELVFGLQFSAPPPVTSSVTSGSAPRRR